jgi:hypothetical protein
MFARVSKGTPNLAEAGYQDGKGFPTVTYPFTTTRN